MLSAIASVFLLSQAVADCPTDETASGRWRIRSGETSCADLAKEAARAKIPARKISVAEQRRIIAHFDKVLVDGPSARWQWGNVVRGHLACLSVNSKNQMGGYSGWSRYAFDLETGESSDLDKTEALFARLEVEVEKHPCA